MDIWENWLSWGSRHKYVGKVSSKKISELPAQRSFCFSMILESLSKVGGEYRATFPWTKWCFVSFCRIKWGDLFCSKWIVTSQFCKLFKDKNFPTFFGSNDHFFLLPFLGKFNFLIRQGKKMQVWTWIYCSLQLGDRLSLMCSKGLLECAFFRGAVEFRYFFCCPIVCTMHSIYNLTFCQFLHHELTTLF